jgi:hypothetical protein
LWRTVDRCFVCSTCEAASRGLRMLCTCGMRVPGGRQYRCAINRAPQPARPERICAMLGGRIVADTDQPIHDHALRGAARCRCSASGALSDLNVNDVQLWLGLENEPALVAEPAW